ncbi:hypothetical protein OIA45_19260 [Streptomyces chartreusis]|uniref:hypothetical protein n=1 Tax=Streptomyces chartreusis TaxID=1969 RepID=UPI003863793B|nr:hypothetical protein OIA45_19260 [Streptomyces chartreusis]
MISHPVEGAIVALQQSARVTFDTYQLDRIDRALDELLRNPSDESTPAEYRVRSAMGHAYEVLERRKTIAPLVSLEAEHTEQGVSDRDYPLVEINEWLRGEPGISQEQRALLQALARGEDAATLAQCEGLPVARVRERISRARRAARELWRASVLAV